jgi:beta-galactosidase
MRATGLDTVKFWACWSWMESRPGQIDFDDLDVLMDLARENGLKVVVNTILEDAPHWLEAAHPEGRYVDEDGRPFHLTAAMNTPGGGWPGLCFDNEPVAAAADTFLERVVTRYREHPALAVWDIWNEPHLEPASYEPDHLYCYCDASIHRFRGWLQGRHATIDGLNERWARRFGSWSEVSPPRRFEAVPDMLDWRESWFVTIREWLERRAAVVRAHDMAHPLMTHVALSGFTGQLATHTLDEFTLSDPVDLFGTSSFPTWLMGGDMVEHLFNLETARDAARGKPFWQAELQGGRGRRDVLHPTGQPKPDEMTLWMWNALAAGATGIVFWQWRPELLGPEAPGYGLCTPSGGATDRTAAVSDFSAIADLPELDGRRADDPTVGLLVSRRTALITFGLDRQMDAYRDAVMGAYRLLVDLDVPVRIIHEDDVEQGGVPVSVDRVVWPMPSVATSRLAQALTSFVQRGGHLLAEALPGEFGPDGRRQAIAPGFGLDTLFGIREIETDTGDLTVSLSTGTAFPGAWMRVAVAPVDSETVGEFSDGATAVATRRFGDGRATHIGTYPSVAYQRSRDPAVATAVRDLLDLDAVPRPLAWIDPSPGLVSRRAVTSSGGSLRFALNWTDDPASFRCPVDGRLVTVANALGSGVKAGELIEVAPRSGSLLVS